MRHTADISADEALKRLIEGHELFLKGETRITRLKRESLAELAEGQHPFATILGCSDSRVPPDWVFDAGIGELFVVRVAGNVLSPAGFAFWRRKNRQNTRFTCASCFFFSQILLNYRIKGRK